MQRFNEETLRQLEQLALIARHIRAGIMKGERRSRKHGSSQEFADFRNYARGDDLRRLDWNVFARLERPFIKLFEEEEDLAVHLLIDASASMAWPSEDDNQKLAYALRLAGALGYVGLHAGDQVGVTLLEADRPRTWGPARGAAQAMSLFGFLDSARAGGTTQLNQALRSYANRGRRSGLLLLFSDLFSPEGYQSGLDAALARGHEVSVLHILSPDERDPHLAGDVKLVDVETGEETELSLDAGSRALYRRRLDGWQAEIAGYCASREATYVPISTDVPWDRLVYQTLRAQQLVR